MGGLVYRGDYQRHASHIPGRDQSKERQTRRRVQGFARCEHRLDLWLRLDARRRQPTDAAQFCGPHQDGRRRAAPSDRADFSILIGPGGFALVQDVKG